MKLVYIAGPYTAPNSWQRECNIRAAEAQCLKLWRAGVAAVCIHTISRHFHGEFPESTAVRIDDEILRRCDAILLVAGWEDSSGTRREITMARGLDRPIFFPDQVQDCITWATEETIE